MQLLFLGAGCVLLLFIYDASAKVSYIDDSNVPQPLSRCFGFYRKKMRGRLIGHAGGSIGSVCDNMYMWHNAKLLNVNRKASKATQEYIDYIFRNTKEEIEHYKTRRFKRQTLPGRRPAYKRVRKEIRMMTDKEWKTYIAAVNSAKKNTSITPNKYDALAEYHTGMTSVSAHGGCNFHGWHRMYILMFENALREEGPEFADVTVPYWDSRPESRMTDPSQSSIFSERLLGTCQGEAKGGIMMNGWDSSTGRIMRTCGTDGPLFTDAMVYNVTRRWRFREICGEDSEIDDDLEFHHNGAHRYIDGQMAMLQSAVYDPIFWAHHTFVDLIWEVFRKNQERHGVDVETDYPINPTTMGAHELHLPTAKLGFGNLNVSDGLSRIFTDEWYEYAPPPTCTVRRPNCRSKYLKCVIDTPPGATEKRARCVARTLAEVIAWEEEQNKPKPPICKNNTNGPVLGKPTPILITKPVQNTFCMNGKSDIKQWVYIPVKVIISRPPEIRDFGTYPVERGRVNKQNGDIYSPGAYQKIRRGQAAPAKYETCLESDEPTNTIFVRSVGLDYEGVYKEYAIVDRRLAVTVATAYLAVRKPITSADASTAILHAQDRCGRVCRPICKDQSGIFRPCSGVVRLTGTRPLQYGNSFGEALQEVWDIDTNTDCPQLQPENIVVSFYCDYKTDWIWPSVDPGVRPPPTLAPFVETTITPGCSLGYGCVISESCNAISPCTHGERLSCYESCHNFARCFNGQFYIHTCRRGEKYDPNSRTGCSRGKCDYKTSGVRNWRGPQKRGKRRRGGTRGTRG